MDFKIIQQTTLSIINAIQNTGIGSVRALKEHTYTAKIDNFPKVQEVKGAIVVGNQKNIEKEVRSNRGVLSNILKAIKSIRFPTEIKVTNFPNPPKFPTEFRVNNFPKYPDFPKEIKISNPPDLDFLNGKIDEVTGAIGKIKLNPKINVEAPKPERVIVPPAQVNVQRTEIDYQKLSQAIASQIPEIDYQKLAQVLGEEMVGRIVSTGSGGGGKWSYKFSDGSGGSAFINKLRQISAVQEDRWGLNHTFKTGQTTYTGEEDVDGNWIIRKIVKAGKLLTMTYATIKNNPSVTNYDDAWDNKDSLVYSRYLGAFELE